MATIGRRSAVAELPLGLRVDGTLGWLAWLVLHLVYLVGFRNRLSVLTSWAWNYVTWDRSNRVIIGLDEVDEKPHRLVGGSRSVRRLRAGPWPRSDPPRNKQEIARIVGLVADGRRPPGAAARQRPVGADRLRGRRREGAPHRRPGHHRRPRRRRRPPPPLADEPGQAQALAARRTVADRAGAVGGQMRPQRGATVHWPQPLRAWSPRAASSCTAGGMVLGRPRVAERLPGGVEELVGPAAGRRSSCCPTPAGGCRRRPRPSTGRRPGAGADAAASTDGGGASAAGRPGRPPPRRPAAPAPGGRPPPPGPARPTPGRPARRRPGRPCARWAVMAWSSSSRSRATASAWSAARRRASSSWPRRSSRSSRAARMPPDRLAVLAV